jgi:hypothetical protein
VQMRANGRCALRSTAGPWRPRSTYGRLEETYCREGEMSRKIGALRRTIIPKQAQGPFANLPLNNGFQSKETILGGQGSVTSG